MKNLNLLQRVKNHSLKSGKKIALKIDKLNISYNQFWHFVDKLSLNILKIKKNSKVIIFGEKNVLTYVSIFSVLKAGGTYIPVSPNIPEERLLKIIKIVKPNIIINSKNSKKKIFKKFKKIQFIDNLNYKANFNENKNHYISNKLKLNKLAYIIFTSGSTGEPKGVKISRESLNNYVNWIVPALKIKNDKSCTQFPDISFDLSVADIFATLCGGGTLIPAYNKYYEMYPARFIEDFKITHLVCVPSYIDLMINSGDLNSKTMRSLESIFFCGEPLMKYHVNSIFNAKKRIKIMNAYGPTEATCSCTYKILTNSNFKKSVYTSMSIGKPIPGTRIILKKNNKENKSEGEIFIRSKQVGDGYINKDANHNKFFFKNKFREFKTGDYAIKKGGDLYFKNRIDNQIKIKGHRIELDEINHNLEKMGFKKVISIVSRDKIYSFISNNKVFKKKIIINKLSKFLPNYMMPNEYFFIKRFPLTKNKKIDTLSLLKNLKKYQRKDGR